MKFNKTVKTLMLSALTAAVFSIQGCATNPEMVKARPDLTVDAPTALHKYTFKKTIDVKGRQGVTTDGEYYYVSGSKTLYKYNKKGELILRNEQPLKVFKTNVNHIGDIDIHNGEIYAGVEYFVDGRGQDIQIAIYDAETLEYKRAMAWNPESGQVEVCGLAVDKDNGLVWMADWVKGSHIYYYDLKTGEYKGKLELEGAPKYQQGILYHNGYIYLTADDGDAEKNEFDKMWRVPADISKKSAKVALEKEFTEVKRVGEIEGLAIDPKTGEFLVHFNRGKRVVLGMPKGFYPDYKREIHEVYIYDMKKK